MNNFNYQFGRRVAELRKSLSKSLSEMAGDLSMEKSSISRYERGINRPSVDFLHKLILNYNVNVNWMITGENEMFLPHFNESFDVYPDVNHYDVDYNSVGEGVFELPIVGEIAAGEPVAVNNTAPLANVFVAGEMINNAPNDHFVFRVNGKSMKPNIEHEDVVFIHKNNNWQYCNGKIVAVRVNGEITLKKLNLDTGNGLIQLLAFNPDYETILVNPSDMDDIELIGILKSIIRKF
jgi:SOS-response transcriptional repressor LexA